MHFSFCTLIFVFAATAQDATPKPAPKAQSVDELLNLPRQNPATPREKAIDRPIEDQPPTEPFALAVEGMRQAADRLGNQNDPGIETQRIQEQVVKRLDMLLSWQRKQQRQNRQKQQSRQQDSGSQKQGQQDQQRQNQGDQAAVSESDPGRVDRQQVKAQQLSDQPLAERFEEWGNLPPRLRDALREGVSEGFSRLYKDLTERYYQRLAEESP